MTRNVIYLASMVSVFATGRQQQDSMSIDEVFRTRGMPALMAPDFEFENSKRDLATVRFYEVTKDVRSLPAGNIERGCFLVFCNDRRFNQHVGYHFEDLPKWPKEWTPGTMFGSLADDGIMIEVLRIDEKGYARAALKERIHVAYFYVGKRDNPGRIPEKAKKAANQSPQPTPGIGTPPAL